MLSRSDLLNAIAACEWAIELVSMMGRCAGVDVARDRAAYSAASMNLRAEVARIDKAAAESKAAAAKPEVAPAAPTEAAA